MKKLTLSNNSIAREVVEGLLLLPQLSTLRLEKCAIIDPSLMEKEREEDISIISSKATNYGTLPRRDAEGAPSASPFGNIRHTSLVTTGDSEEVSVVPRDRSLSKLAVSGSTLSQGLLASLLKRTPAHNNASSLPSHRALSWQAIIARCVDTLTYLHLSDDDTLQHLHLSHCYHLESVTLISMSALESVNVTNCYALEEFEEHNCPSLAVVLLVPSSSSSSLPRSVVSHLQRLYHTDISQLMTRTL